MLPLLNEGGCIVNLSRGLTRFSYLGPSDYAAMKVEEWDRMIDVNIHGVLYGIAAVLPPMRERKIGHIINVSSIGAHRVSPTAAVCCATKFAVRPFRRVCARRRHQESIDVRVATIALSSRSEAKSRRVNEGATARAPTLGLWGFGALGP